MISYLLRRLALAVSMIWAVSFASFVAFGLSFDPTFGYNLCGTEDCRLQRLQLIREYHLHDPILSRYSRWLAELPSHGFGTAVTGFYGVGDGKHIGTALWPALWVSLQLLGAALVLVVLLSVFVGAVSARLAGTPLDWLLRLLAYVTWSLPAFLVGVLLIHGLGGTGWFDIGGPHPGFGGWLRWIALPAISLSLGFVGLYGRYIRSAMLVSLRQPYADVARGKGLRESRVVLRHALRNSLIPFTSVLTLDLAAVVGATLAIDYVFHMNGLAVFFFQSLGNADPFVLTAVLVTIGGVVAAASFLGDLVVGWLDPRIRVAELR
jgi:peptide/nickel transport system permease protein